jgi:glycosyltransferase involved in cell wall biosynthesis
MGDLHAISSYGPEAASTRVRLNDWFRFLGIEPIHHYYTGLRNNRPRSMAAHPVAVAHAEFALRRLAVTGQRVILSREASPLSRGDAEERLIRSASHAAYDFDDALFDDPSPIRRFVGMKDKCRRAALAADIVIAGNYYLANWAEQHNRNVQVIPSCVDPHDYAPKVDWSIRGEAPELLWLGSPGTEKFVAQIAPALLEINRRSGALLTIISGPAHNASLGDLNRMIRRTPWNIGTFASTMAKADIAIAPLDDSPYSRGKCAYKLLQYAATGLPIVGSPIGASELALRRFNGIEARSLDDWIQGLSQILASATSTRATVGTHEQIAVKTHYSFEAWESKWRAAVGITENDRR